MQVRGCVKKLDKAMSYVLARLEEMGLADEVNILITSPFGISSVPGDNIMNLTGLVNHTMAYVIPSTAQFLYYVLPGKL